MRNDQGINPYVPPSARVEDAASDAPWHARFRVFRAVRWAFLAWLGSTLVSGVLGGLAGRQLAGTYIESFAEAAVLWAWVASFTISLVLAVVVFPVGLFLRIPARHLARLVAPRVPPGRESVVHAQEVAATHLHAPMYIADYAKMEGMRLDDVHREIQQGRLQAFWHDGIAFVDVDTSCPSAISRRCSEPSMPS
jgi:MFS family permease